MSSEAVHVTLIPASCDAEETVKLRANRSYITHTKLGSLNELHPPHKVAIQLNLAMMLGRQCLAFGSSRSCHIQLPSGEDVSDQQFILFFQLHSLWIKDTSSHGIWLSPISSKGPPTSLYQDEAPMMPSVLIQFGHGNRLKFHLHVHTKIFPKPILEHTDGPLQESDPGTADSTFSQAAKRRRSSGIEEIALALSKRSKLDNDNGQVVGYRGECGGSTSKSWWWPFQSWFT
jgi:hypothetical protein